MYNVQLGNVIDASQYGVIGDGSDQTQAFQTLIKNAPTGVTLILPPGKITISSTVDFTYNVHGKNGVLDCLRLKGSSGTLLSASFPGPILARNMGVTPPQDGGLHLESLSIANYNQVAGIGVWATFLGDVKIKDCFFGDAFIGLHLDTILDSAIIESCEFSNCVLGAEVAGVTLDLFRVKGFSNQTCLKLVGDCNLYGGHFEENETALEVAIVNGIVSGCDFEANLTHVQVTKMCRQVTLQGLNILGDLHDGKTNPNYGIDLQPGCGMVTMINCGVGGNFINSAIHCGSSAGAVVALNVYAKSTSPTGVPNAWDISAVPPAQLTKLQCLNNNQPL